MCWVYDYQSIVFYTLYNTPPSSPLPTPTPPSIMHPPDLENDGTVYELKQISGHVETRHLRLRQHLFIKMWTLVCTTSTWMLLLLHSGLLHQGKRTYLSTYMMAKPSRHIMNWKVHSQYLGRINNMHKNFYTFCSFYIISFIIKSFVNHEAIEKM